MSDRVIRDELMRSRRFRRLPTDTHRILFIYLCLSADPFGNLECEPEDVCAMLARPLSDDDAIALRDALKAADLIRPYSAEGRDLWHIPRYRQRLKFSTGRLPRPPKAIEDPWIAQAIRNKQLRGKDSADTGTAPQADATHTGTSHANARAGIDPDGYRHRTPDVDVDVDVEKNRARENPATPPPIAAALAPLLQRIEKAKDQAKANPPSATAATTAVDAPPKTPPASSGAWWSSQAGIEAKALELAMPANPGERWPDWVSRLRQADADRQRKPRKAGTAAHQAPPAT